MNIEQAKGFLETLGMVYCPEDEKDNCKRVHRRVECRRKSNYGEIKFCFI